MNIALWEEIKKFDFDFPLSEYGFSTRLAYENEWTTFFTQKAIEEYGTDLKVGMGDYWNSKVHQMFLGKPIIQVNRNLKPYFWITNRSWYNSDAVRSGIDFVLPDRLDESLLLNKLGEPLKVKICKNGDEIWIYNESKTKAFTDDLKAQYD